MLKTFLMPLGCFGIPLTAGFIVLSVSGVVDIPLFSSNSEEDEGKLSKYRLVEKTYKSDLTPQADDDEIADEKFMESIASSHKTVIRAMPKEIVDSAGSAQTQNIPSQPGATTAPISEMPKEIKGNKLTVKPTKKATKGDIRKIQNKINSHWYRSYFRKIVDLFAKYNADTYRNFVKDVILLFNDYWSTELEKNNKITQLIQLYSSEISQFTEYEKRFFKNQLENLIL